MPPALSPRERQIARLVVRGHTNAEIANSLGISPLTAKWHVSEILRKLGFRRRVQLAFGARELGLAEAEADPYSSAG